MRPRPPQVRPRFRGAEAGAVLPEPLPEPGAGGVGLHDALSFRGSGGSTGCKRDYPAQAPDTSAAGARLRLVCLEPRPAEASSDRLDWQARPYVSADLDGVSLTIAALSGNHFDVALIPTTLKVTTLAKKNIGWPFNLEADIISKQIVHFLEQRG